MPTHFGNLETPELRIAAAQEAESLMVDPQLLEGRPRLKGYTINISPDLEHGMALSVAEENSKSELHISLADVGTFIPPDSAMRHLAQRTVNSNYGGGHVLSPMLPRVISEEKLGLVDGQERPALTITFPIDEQGAVGFPRFRKTLVTARFLTLTELEERYVDEGDEGDITLLDDAAQALFAARHKDPETPQIIQDEMGVPLARAEMAISSFILAESRFALNAAVAALLWKVPNIYRIKGCKPGVHGKGPEPSWGSYWLQSEYSDLGFQRYSHADQPLSRYGDLLVNANLAAFLEGKPLPFVTASLMRAVKSLNNRERTLGRPIEDGWISAHGAESAAKPVTKTESAKTLLARFYDGSAHDKEIAFALLGEVQGSPETIHLLRRVAADAMSKRFISARSVVSTAIGKKWLTQKNNPDETVTFTDARDNSYTLTLAESKKGEVLAGMIASITGLEIQPEPQTLEQRIRQEPGEFLRKLPRMTQGAVRYRLITAQDASGLVTLTANLTINGTLHVRARRLSVNSQKERDTARNLLNNAVIDEFKLTQYMSAARQESDKEN